MGAGDHPWVLPSAFALSLHMETDWHVGTGAGRPGDVDRLTARDGEGLPYVPAKTLKGLWREACAEVATALDGGEVGPWTAWQRWLFGDRPAHGDAIPDGGPRAGALQVRPARLPAALRCTLCQLEPGSPLREAVTFAKPGVRIDPDTGRAMDDHLRWVEMARGGVILEAPCLLPPLDGVSAAAASALLHAGARLLRGLGGGRRRGAGRCRAEIAGAGALNAVWAWLEHQEELPPPPALTAGWAPAIPAVLPTPDEPWLCVPLRIRLEAPLLVAAERRGSVTTSAPEVPGGVLLSLLARTLDLDVPALLAAKALVVLPAVTEVDGARGRPLPLSWAAAKGADPVDGQALNLLGAPLPPGHRRIRGGYLGVTTAGAPVPLARAPAVVHRMHNSIGWKPRTGTLFTYGALAPGQSLRAEIRIPEAIGKVLPWDRLRGRHALGRSKQDDYGLVDIDPLKPHSWSPASGPPPGDRLTLWVQSAVLLRDARLRPDPSLEALVRVLGEALGVTLRPEAPGERTAAHALRRIRAEGWQVSWGLPRPTLVGIAPGACAVLAVEGRIDPARWSAVLLHGIGDRTAEGFGQVCFDDPLVTEPRVPALRAACRAAGTAAPPPALSPTEDGHAQAIAIERAAMRERVGRAALRLADDRERLRTALGFDGERPTRAQAGTLRGIAARLADDPQAGTRWCEHVRSGGERLRKWDGPVLEGFARLTDPARGEVWRLLGLDDIGPRLTAVDPREGLWAAAVLQVVEACARAHQRRLQQQGKGTDE